jgi:hypothetical protein
MMKKLIVVHDCDDDQRLPKPSGERPLHPI